MTEIYKTQDVVDNVLHDYPYTRGSDVELYVKVCEVVNPTINNMPFLTVMRHRKELGLPNYETVGRVRRKLQAENPNIRATKDVEDVRYENFKEFREYALQ